MEKASESSPALFILPVTDEFVISSLDSIGVGTTGIALFVSGLVIAQVKVKRSLLVVQTASKARNRAAST
ncbi:MAG TPA: hypothetical protein VMJ11_01000 [Paraburkholderia sp.]|uniref:hypothetical protein n=1 Tax=Paraburkholderia sp. TaxID=1926495 RepID=UPI002BFBE1CD|nr:hypothetical protein [Paraburkholderia sp.]HTR05252.1 hypothetical protein [Paraburkholderia sp.]